MAARHIHISPEDAASRGLQDGLIVAARHIHISPEHAAERGLHDGEFVDVHVGDGERGLVFSRTRIRVQDDAYTEMHIDTDEANAAGISVQGEGALARTHAATPMHHHTSVRGGSAVEVPQDRDE